MFVPQLFQIDVGGVPNRQVAVSLSQEPHLWDMRRQLIDQTTHGEIISRRVLMARAAA